MRGLMAGNWCAKELQQPAVSGVRDAGIRRRLFGGLAARKLGDVGVPFFATYPFDLTASPTVKKERPLFSVSTIAPLPNC